MAIDIVRWWEGALIHRQARLFALRLKREAKHLLKRYRFNSITRRIIVINVVGLCVLVSGIFYLDKYRSKFVGNRVETLTTQAEIIAAAIAQTSKTTGDTPGEANKRADESKIALPSGLANTELTFRVDPEVVSPMLRDLIAPTKTRARIFDTEGTLIADSRQLYRYSSGLDGSTEPAPNVPARIWASVKGALWTPNLPLYKDHGPEGKAYDEVRVALAGSVAPLIRETETGATVISIAAPIRRERVMLGALLLTAQGSDIDDMIAQDRFQIVEVAGLVAFVTAILSLLLAGTIAEPMRRLARAAEKVQHNIQAREQIPEFSHRPDEIGDLARALRDMTNALYSRLDAIESFAADVSHELKNPLTSLRSAANLLPSIKSDEDRKKLVDIINHDVRRLDRLITDIADASRLDGELARETSRPVNVASLLRTLCEVMRESRRSSGITIVLDVQGCRTVRQFTQNRDYIVNGHDSRMSQVIANLLENAISFSPPQGTVYVSARRLWKEDEIEICVEDEGPGIRDENLEKIFERFYTDRPGAFGQNSGLGLNISQQIIKAHGGSIWSENRISPKPLNLAMAGGVARDFNPVPVPKGEMTFACGVRDRYSWGARFVIRLPAYVPPR